MGVPRFLRLAGEGLEMVRALTYQRSVAYERSSAELAYAGRVQASFIPEQPPHLPGWDLSAALKPARQMSGDFYDFVPLAGGQMAVIIADVADKGASAALYMALSRTYLRHALRQHGDPARALQAANERMLAETHSDLFVTVFVGLIAPEDGTLTYSNAGHNPPLLARTDGSAPEALTRTGMALGILDDTTWSSRVVHLGDGDLLCLYTDGITEAQTHERELFGVERLTNLIQRNRYKATKALEQDVFTAVAAFTAGAPQFDDMALVIAKRHVIDSQTAATHNVESPPAYE
jgi:sigma-B regulation protein RsbU (phosphoserine phosphatase)